MKEQHRLETVFNKLRSEFNSDSEQNLFSKKYYFIASPNPIHDSEDKKLKIGFVVYNRETDKCTSELYIPITDLIKDDNFEDRLIKIKEQLQQKIKEENI